MHFGCMEAESDVYRQKKLAGPSHTFVTILILSNMFWVCVNFQWTFLRRFETTLITIILDSIVLWLHVIFEWRFLCCFVITLMAYIFDLIWEWKFSVHIVYCISLSYAVLEKAGGRKYSKRYVLLLFRNKGWQRILGKWS